MQQHPIPKRLGEPNVGSASDQPVRALLAARSRVRLVSTAPLVSGFARW
jgi:hypothetical protein